MKICVAQTSPVSGNVAQNIDNHKKLIGLAVSQAAQLIVFPELSLTGYEPLLAKELAMDAGDTRLAAFQLLSDAHEITIEVGMPVKTGDAVAIGMVIFQPGQPRQTYFKKHIHADEEPYFVGASGFTGLLGGDACIAPAICYELSVPEHAAQAFRAGAKIYIASVSKLVRGIDKALDRLAEIASTYALTVLMSNQTGWAEGEVCAGKSSIWNGNGRLLAQLDDLREGILMIDMDTQEVTEQYL